MKDLRPPYARTTIDGARELFCTPCGAYRAAAHFYATAVRKQARRCKACWNKNAKQLRGGSALARMLHSVRVRIRAGAGGDRELARAWEISDMVDVLRRHGVADDGGGLCLVRIDPAKPLRPSNARPMPTRRARGRHHLRRR